MSDHELFYIQTMKETLTRRIIALFVPMPVWTEDGPPDPQLGFYRTVSYFEQALKPHSRQRIWNTVHVAACLDHIPDPSGDGGEEVIFRIADPADNGLVFCRRSKCKHLEITGGCPIELLARQKRLITNPDEETGLATQLSFL